MRLATYDDGTGRERVGVVDGPDGALTVSALPTDAPMRDLVAAGLDEVRRLAGRAEAPAPLDRTRLRAPLQPASLRDFVAFEEHVEGVRRSVDGASGVPEAWYDAPTFYFANPHTVLGDGADVAFPHASVARDLELEVAVVLGAGGSSLTEAEGAAAIFGYTVMNDWSARDLQSREMQVGLGPAKGKDFATTLGPWIVTADELDDRADADGFLRLGCTVEVNGSVVGHDLLSNMGWTFPAMVAHAARDSRVAPGDVLGSGTTGNGGCLAELWGRRGVQDPPPLVDGDVVTVRVEGIGHVTNRVTTAPAPPAAGTFRPPSRERPALTP